MSTDSISNKSKLWYRLSEIGIIVFSILLAFWIDAWWQGKQATEREVELLSALRLETQANRVELDEYLFLNNRQIRRMEMFFDSTPPELFLVESDSMSRWVAGVSQYWTFDPESSAATQLLSYNGELSERGRSIRQLVTRWQRADEDMGEDKDGMIKASDDIVDLVALSSAEAVAFDIGFISEMAALRGPKLLEELRSNPKFVAAVMVKAHRQRVYLIELNQASEILDSLMIALE